MKIRAFILYDSGLYQPITIQNDIFGVYNALQLSLDENRICENDIYLSYKRYRVYGDEEPNEKYKIVAKSIDGKSFFIGNSLIVKINKNDELITMIDEDIAIIQDSFIVCGIKKYLINRKTYISNEIVLRF